MSILFVGRLAAIIKVINIVNACTRWPLHIRFTPTPAMAQLFTTQRVASTVVAVICIAVSV